MSGSQHPPRKHMPRRANLAVAIREPTAPQPDPHYDNLLIIRKQWHWAAFSQFFYTFSPLFPMNDITIADIERDLTCNTKLVIPRIMQKLLYAVSNDRKVSVDNWQTALRKQYYKRDPQANPMGPDPRSIQVKEEEVQDDDKEMAGGNHPRPKPNGEVPKDHAANGSELGVSVPTATLPSTEPNVPESASNNDLTSTRQSSVTGARQASAIASNVDSEDGQQESIDWFDLALLAKLESMYNLTEWQFQNPLRLRMQMKSDDELATWRIEPIGYDSKRNAYWFIGTDRLWIQRVPMKPARSKALKRKRAAPKTPAKQPIAKLSSGNKRPRLASNSPSTPRHSRAAKDQAKMKLDAQAKELEELNKQASLADGSKPRKARQTGLRSKKPATPSRPVGTRVSARLRGAQDEEWQPIPEEWLDEARSTRSSKRLEVQKTGLESDEGSESDLTELSEETSDPTSRQNEEQEMDGVNHDEPEAEPDRLNDDFVEWETICVTLYEWEHIAERFEKATHYAEKALYKVLTKDIVPAVTEDLRGIERQRQLEEALVHRKRSSRLAVRESEKQEARMASIKQHEDEEKMSRARRLEARQQREEEERLKQEHAREQRRKEREAREEARKAQVAAQEAKAKADAERAAEKATKKRKSSSPARDARKAKARKSSAKDLNGPRMPAREDWELACEICQRQGINLDDGTPMMSCGICSRWQHIQCHDRADREAGRPRRNWNSVDFICGRCRATQHVQYTTNYRPSAVKPVPLHLTTPKMPPSSSPQVQPYGSYAPIMPQSAHTGHPQDHRAPTQYLSGYRDPAPQNGQQYPNAQTPYTPGPSTHPTLSFSHYQPAQQSFSASGSQKPTYASVHYPYGHSNTSNAPQHYQQYRQEQHPGYKPQTASPAWNVNSPAQAPVYPTPTNSQTTMGSTSTYRPSMPDNRDNRPSLSPANHEAIIPASFTRYPVDQYSSNQFKHPVSYQPTSGR